MVNNSVRVHLRGGLGNQLFQYGAGLALSRKLGSELLLDASALPMAPIVKSGVSHWPEQISQFRHTGLIISHTHTTSPSAYLRTRLLQLERAIGDLIGSRIPGLNAYANNNRSNVERFSMLSGPKLRINAYCNDAAYFLQFAGLLREQIRDVASPSEAYLDLKKRALDEQPIGLHMRLGDYKNLPHIYGELDLLYFKRAVDLLREIAGDRPVWLFSDESELALSMLGNSIRGLQTPGSLNQITGLETLNLLGITSGLVGSSSSFSWWGAFLNQNSGFQAVFPRPLFAKTGPPEPKSALQESWIQLGRRA